MPVPETAEHNADDWEAEQFLAADRLFVSQFSIFCLSLNRHQYCLMTILHLSLYNQRRKL